jgi:hypothetical protein
LSAGNKVSYQKSLFKDNLDRVPPDKRMNEQTEEQDLVARWATQALGAESFLYPVADHS